MKHAFFLSLVFSLFLITAVAQSNPRLNARVLVGSLPVANQEMARQVLKQGEFYYRERIYHQAYFYLRQLYDQGIQHPALFYKLGVSALLGNYSPHAANYLEKVADTLISPYYFFHLGNAYMAAMDYPRARDAFTSYYNSLGACAQRRFSARYQLLLEKCAMGPGLANDSLPYFIICMGPSINTPFDDFAAVEHPAAGRIFFTSRRPDRVPENPVNPGKFPERVHWSEYKHGFASESTPVARLNNGHNTSVAGIDQINERLFVYTGKRRGGGIRQSELEGGEPKRAARIRGVANSKAFRESFMSVNKEGDVYFISNRRGGQGGKDIWKARGAGQRGVRKARNLGALVNTPFDEKGVYVTPDGTTLYFASNGHPGMGNFDLFRSERQPDGNWGEPVNLGYPVNSPADDVFFFPTSDTLASFVSSNRYGGFGGLDIFKARFDTRLPFSVWGEVRDNNSREILPARIIILDAINGNALFFASLDKSTGEYFMEMEDKGNFVIRAEAPGYVSSTIPLQNPLTRHETIRHDFFLERLLFPFTLTGTIANRQTGEPVQAEIRFRHVGSDSVAYRAYSDLSTGYYSITFADKVDMTMEVVAIDYFPVVEALHLKSEVGTNMQKNFALQRSRVQYTVAGVVTDRNTGQPLVSTVSLTIPGQSQPLATTISDQANGRFVLVVEETGPFLLEVNAQGYFFVNQPLRFHPDSTLIVRNVELTRMITGSRVVIGNILFATGNAILKAESYPELNRLANLLNQNREVRVRISGHTDNIGSASSNKRLSRDRALAVKSYLESLGIGADRIEFEGHGFEKPIAPNTTPEGRAANRRVEIEVID